VSYTNNTESRNNFFAGNYTRSSYDLTSYKIQIDTQGKIQVSNLRGCKGKHQGEISFFHSSGFIQRVEDTTKIIARTHYSKFYVIEITKKGIIDSFSSTISIELVSSTLKKSYCPNLVMVNPHLSICALPSNVKRKQVYKAIHRDSNIGEFTFFSIVDSMGKSIALPQGDYVIIGGNTLDL